MPPSSLPGSDPLEPFFPLHKEPFMESSGKRSGHETRRHLLGILCSSAGWTARHNAARSLLAGQWEPETMLESACLEIGLGHWSAVSQLGKVAVAPLASLLEDPDEDIRCMVLSALSQIDHESAVAPLLASLSDASKKVRSAAARALGRRGDPQVVPRLAQALCHEGWRLHEGLRRKVAKLLAELDVPPQVYAEVQAMIPAFVHDQMAWMGAWRTGVRQATTEAIRSLRPELRTFSTAHLHALFTLRPQWASSPPAPAELERVSRAITWLPPIGGKIPVVLEGHPLFDLQPTWTAEEQVVLIAHLRRLGYLGSKGYVHQLTVQGRLPDESKAIAIALITSSPYPHDWEEPFFEAPWGCIAPLVHDGGNLESNVNPLWKELLGRTDFLQRLARIHEPSLELLESMNEEERFEHWIQDVSLAERFEKERAERHRLVLEARAFQRLALALHAVGGRIPATIPAQVRKELVNLWTQFRSRLGVLLEQADADGALKTAWFSSEPRRLDWLEERFEAPWPPIQAELQELELKRSRQPALRIAVVQLLQEITDQIDLTIGLAP